LLAQVNYQRKVARASVAARGANLNGAQLVNGVLSGANLASATTAGANFSGAVWPNTSCPDGTNSSAHGLTCVGHL